jgi:hypothetical protein
VAQVARELAGDSAAREAGAGQEPGRATGTASSADNEPVT